MAMCERCRTKGYSPKEMRASLDGTQLLGPCCSTQTALPAAEPEFEWGVRLSSKEGLQAFAKFGELQLSFNKSFHELKELVGRIQ